MAVQGVVGQEIRYTFYDFEALQEFDVLTFTLDGVHDALGASVFFEDIDGGDYVLTFTPEETGLHYIRWVGDVSGVIHDETFQVVTPQQADPLGFMSATPVSFTSPLTGATRAGIVQGDTYNSTGRRLVWATTEAATWPVLTGGSAELWLDQIDGAILATFDGLIVQPTGDNKLVQFDLLSAQTDVLPEGRYTFQVKVTVGESVYTLVSGVLTVERNLASP